MIELNRCNQNDLKNLIKGACLLASGGGGTFSSSKKLVDAFTAGEYYSDAEFEMITKDDALEGGGYAAVIAYIGAPQALENVTYPKAAVEAAKKVSDYIQKQGHELKYLVPVETGSLSSLVPCLVAAKENNLTVMDCDGAGRAVPELTMLTFSGANVGVNPTFLTNDDHYSIQLGIDGEDPVEVQESAAASVENLVRPVLGLKQFNEIAGLGIWIMSPEDIKRAVQIEGTLTQAMKLGKALTENSDAWSKDSDKLIDYLNEELELKAYKLFEGTFVANACSTATAGGFDHGQITLRDKTDTTYTGIFQNETLLGWKSDKASPIAMAPDSIAYYVHDTQQVYSNGDIINDSGTLNESLKGKTVTVIGIAADKALRTTESNKVRSALFQERMKEGTIMKSFKKVLLDLGYAGPYVPIEDIQK